MCRGKCWIEFSMIVGIILLRTVRGRTTNGLLESDYTNIYTDTNHNYTKYGLSLLNDRTSFVFRLKACSDGHIALLPEWGKQYDVLDVVIGCCHNTASMIRNGAEKTHYADALTPGVLHCAEFRTFWIDWGYEHIEVGYGPVVGSQLMMQTPRIAPLNQPVRFIAFSTGWDYTGVWQIPQNQGYFMTLYTPDDFQYNYIWRSYQQSPRYILFHVKACHDVHLNLSPVEGQVKYEVSIGGLTNTKSTIHAGGEEKDVHDENDLLDCNEYRYFWMSWAGGIIRVGKGTVFLEAEILSWTDPAFVPVSWLSVSTGYGSDGRWTFYEYQESEFMCEMLGTIAGEGSLEQSREKTIPHGHGLVNKKDILPQVQTKAFGHTPLNNYLYVRIRSCEDVRLIIYHGAAGNNETRHQIYIGAYGNTKSGVFASGSQKTLREVDTPGVLDCTSHRGFSLAWTYTEVSTIVTLGQVENIIYKDLLVWEIVGGRSFINAVEFGGSANTGVDFLIWKNSGINLFVTTSTTLSQPLWIKTEMDFNLQFWVKACRNVVLTLFSRDDQTKGHRIDIGKDGNQVIIKSIEGKVCASTEVNDILTCDDYRSFWIGWLGGNIQVGRGFKYGLEQLLSCPEPSPYLIGQISLNTEGTGGNFATYGDSMDIIEMLVSSVSEFKWLHLRPGRESWFYFSLFGSATRLKLSETYRDTSNAFVIYIGADQNTRCAIYKGKTQLASSTTPDVLHANDLRNFWVSWRNGKIQLGQGKVIGYRVLVEYIDGGKPDIQAVGVSAAHENSISEWRFYEPFFDEVSYDTSPLQGQQLYQQLWTSVRDRSHVLLGLQSCGSAEIILGAAMYNMQYDFYYKLEIQTDEGRTNLWINKRHVAEWANTPGIVSCDTERLFWLSWFEGTIVFGQDHQIGSSAIISYQDLNGFPVAALGLATRSNNTVWRLSLHRGLGLRSLDQGGGLSGGEIAGIVIGVFLMIGLIAGAVYILYRPPTILQPCLDPAGTTSTSSPGGNPLGAFSNAALEPAIRLENPRQQAAKAEVPTSFDNVVFEDDSEA